MRFAIVLVAVAIALASCSQGREHKLVRITGNDEMKFDLARFEVRPGQKVTLTLTNAGELPREAMAHNWVLLKKGTDAARLAGAGVQHPKTGYIPEDQVSQVLAKTRLLGPGDSDSITFTAPTEPGPYDYICTFPDHYAGGMKGVMTVTSPAK
jgi:azurin